MENLQDSADDTRDPFELLLARVELLESENIGLKKAVDRLAPKKEPHIPRFCTLGAGASIAPDATFYASTESTRIDIGAGTKVLRGAEWIGPIKVGSRGYFNRDSYVRANVTIGDNVNVGPFVRIVSDGHDLGPASRRAGKNNWLPIRIGSGTWIGAGAVITGGVTIGKSCVIAAGAVVASDVPDNTMFGGVPAKKIKDLD